MTIGEKIKSFRNIRRISQKTLAELSGVSEGAIRKHEAGTRNSKPAKLKKFAQSLELDDTAFLDLSLSYLILKPLEMP